MVPLDWWPVSRDCLAYGVTVAILICIIHDERVEWYEALSLVLLYIVYIAVMYYDKSFQRCTRFRRKNSAAPEDLNPRPSKSDSILTRYLHFVTRTRGFFKKFDLIFFIQRLHIQFKSGRAAFGF